MPRHTLLSTLGLLLLAASSLAGGLTGLTGLTEDVNVVSTWDGRADYRTVIGHATGGVTLAIIGTGSGTAFVDVTTPASPVEVGFIPGPPGDRTVAAFQNVAYAAGSSGGLQVISLASPTNPTLSTTLTTFDQAARLLIDTDDDVLYVAGTEQGLLGFDLATPLAPASIFDPMNAFPVVAGVARRPFAYVATGSSLAVIDISNPPTARLYGWITYPGAVSTMTQLSPDRRRILVTDARPGAGALRVYDVSDPKKARLIAETPHALTPGVGALDVSWSGSSAYVAWGTSGLEVLDTTDDTAPARVGAYASDAPDASGIVSVYARTASGLAYALDAAAGLAVLQHDSPYGTVTGVVTDSGTQSAMGGVAVRAAGRHTLTATNGTYTLAVPPGTQDVAFEVFRFAPRTVSVPVSAGTITTQDVALDRLPYGTLRGSVNLGRRPGDAAARELHPEGTIVRVLDTPIVFPAGFAGVYLLPGMPVGTYIVEGDRFGYDAQQFEVTVSEGQETTQDFLLPPCTYFDNLEADSAWTMGASGDGAVTGIWARVKPIGTGAGYVQPERDETPDPDSTAFVTGNGAPGGWIDAADVDGGTTTVMTKRLDLTGVIEPIFRYYRWFSNDAAWQGESYDGDAYALDVSADDGATWTNLERLTSSALYWGQADFVISQYVTPTDAMRFRVQVTDGGAPSIVEAAFDDIEVWSGAALVVFPPTPIDLGSVSAVSTAPGSVTLRWIAPGHYDGFDIERARPGEEPVRITTLPAAPGEHYVFTDRSAPPGRAVRYWIVGQIGDRSERTGPYLVWVQGALPRSLLLAPAPNPTGGPATVRYEVADELGDGRPVGVTVRLFDASGRWLATLVDGARTPGRYALDWDGRDARGRTLPSGVYWFRLETPSGTSSGRIVRAR